MHFLSVIICTHNPRPDYLERVLGALKAQTLPRGQWELLLIDNASTKPLAGCYDASWHPRFRLIREDELGLTHARLRGIAESTGELLVYVDDDNVLDSDYLQCARSIAQDYPLIGAWGGSCIAEFEEAPDPDLKDFLPYLALREVNSPKWSNYGFDSMPVGAGLCVRNKVAQSYSMAVNNMPIRKMLDRRGASLMAGGDFDLAMTSYPMGLGTGIFPQLRLCHLIPKRRLTETYLYNMSVGSLISYHLVRFFHLNEIPRRPNFRRRLLERGRQLLWKRSNRFSQAHTEGREKAISMIQKLSNDVRRPR